MDLAPEPGDSCHDWEDAGEWISAALIITMVDRRLKVRNITDKDVGIPLGRSLKYAAEYRAYQGVK